MAQLTSSEAKHLYFDVFQHLSVEVHIWQLVRDADGSIVSWKLIDANPRALNSWGKSLEEVKGKRTEEIFLGADPVKQFFPIIEKIYATNSPIVWEEFFPGTKQTLQMTTIPLGEFFISIGKDVSEERRLEIEQKNALAAMVEKLKIFESVIENSSDFVGIANNEMRPFYCNPAGRSLIGFPQDQDVTEIQIPECFPEEIREHVCSEIFKELGEDRVWVGETYFRNFKTNEKIPVHDMHFNIKDKETSKIIGHATISRDLRKFKELEAELEREHLKLIQASKLATLGEMAAGVAHEINNPLSIISGCSSILRKSDISSDVKKEHLEKIGKAVDRISKIVTGLSKFSRAGEKDLSIKKVNLNKLANECLDLLKPKSNRHHVEIKTNIASNVVISCDEIQIEQILINLIGNAIDAVAESDGPWIEVAYFSESKFDTIVVKDSGNGIADDIVEKLFNPFFTTKEVGKGTGLGLSISKGIALDHDGDLEYRLVDGHTAFLLKLPRLVF